LRQEEIRRVFDFFLRPPGNSPYDAVFGFLPGPNYSPVVARTTIHARQILTGRSSYLKAFLIHSRGGHNINPCNNCSAAVNGDRPYTAFAGCVSIPGEWNGACSNCVWADAGARCRFSGSRGGVGPSKGPIGPSNGSSGPKRGRKGRAIQGPSSSSQLVDADD
jgi:hypothetical protein